MTNTGQNLLIAFVVIILSLGLGYCVGSRHGTLTPAQPETTIQRDTIRDTIKYYQPVPKDSVVLRYLTVKLPTKDTVFVKGADNVLIDSIMVEVPISQKEYKDSTYHAWVSGFNPNLDSIQVYQKTITEVKHTKEMVKNRWGLGIQIGAGYGYNRFTPYVGVGVSYNVLTW